MSSRPPYVLITGASAGIGAALAREFARRGEPLVLTARRRERLDALAEALRPQVDCIVLPADLAAPTAAAELQAALADRGVRIGTLVNNAGYGVPGAYHAVDWPRHAEFIQVMVTAVCELSHRFLPDMRAAGRGRILNVASLAGHVPGSAGQTLYAAAKAFMIKLSQSLALENAAHGIRVCALCPGFTWSEFHDVVGSRAMMSRLPRWMWMDADTVARAGIDALDRGDVVYIPGRVNRTIKTLVKLMPDTLALRMMRRQSRRFRGV